MGLAAVKPALLQPLPTLAPLPFHFAAGHRPTSRLHHRKAPLRRQCGFAYTILPGVTSRLMISSPGNLHRRGQLVTQTGGVAFNVDIDTNTNNRCHETLSVVRGDRRRPPVLSSTTTSGAAGSNNIGESMTLNNGNGWADFSCLPSTLTGLGLTAASQIQFHAVRDNGECRRGELLRLRRHGRHGDQPAVHLGLRRPGTARGRWFAGHVTSGRFLPLVAASEAQGRLIRLNFAHENGEPL